MVEEQDCLVDNTVHEKRVVLKKCRQAEWAQSTAWRIELDGNELSILFYDDFHISLSVRHSERLLKDIVFPTRYSQVVEFSLHQMYHFRPELGSLSIGFFEGGQWTHTSALISSCLEIFAVSESVLPGSWGESVCFILATNTFSKESVCPPWYQRKIHRQFSAWS